MTELLVEIEQRLDRISGTLDVILFARGIHMDDPETWPEMPAAEKKRIIALLEEGEGMRLFELIRETDVSGVSGTGPVAEVVEFSNGWVVVAFYEHTAGVQNVICYGSVEDAERIHGHGGLTKLVPCLDLLDFKGIEGWEPAPVPARPAPKPQPDGDRMHG